MNKHPNTVKNTLLSLISEMSANPVPYVKNPGKDFTRDRKLPFEAVVKSLISMGGNSIYKELLEANDYAPDTATTSAFVQQRDKILPSAFEFLFRMFTETHSNIRKHRGYRIFAVDGSDLNSVGNPDDADSFFQNRPGEKGYNLTHLNALYDLCNKIYVDALPEPRRLASERRTLTEMVRRSSFTDKVIVIADRGYESYNIFAHIENKGWNYVIRVKDLNRHGIVSTLELPDGEFDVCVSRILTRKQTKEVKSNPDIYRFMPSISPFDFFDPANPFYTMSFRIVRFKMADDSYETLITNLDTKAFPSHEIKELYRMRWGIETAFRELKYTVGLTSFHTKKQEHITQEIFARLIMYNFAEMITSHVVISKADTKHTYQVNFTVATHICRHFLRSNAPPPDIDALIRKNVLPVRAGRYAKRAIRYKSAVSFLYRVA